MTKVFIGGTNKDLMEYHKAAAEACLDVGLHPMDMKNFPAQSKGATQASLDDLDKCDLYIGIFAFRYGYEEEGYGGVSVTDMEFRHAEERKLDRLCFLAEESKWTGMKDANLTKVSAFRDNVGKLVVKFFGDDVNDFKAKVTAALARWKEENPSRPGGTSAVLFTEPDDVQEKPAKLFGREDLLSKIDSVLDNKKRVLLHGFGGMGKTALAAYIVAEWIRANKGNVLWLRLGTNDADALCEALARPFGAQQQIASQVGDARLTETRKLLRSQNLGLLVLDDAWSGGALFQLLKAMPADLPLIITSRQTYSIDGDFFDVAELPENDAVQLVAYHSKLNNDPDMRTLCKKLGYHAFALTVAGRTMHTRKWSAVEMLQQIKDAPHELETPLEFSEKEKTSVKELLDASIAALPDDAARNVFFAFGAFFAPRLTPEILKLYFIDKPEVTPEMLAEVRAAANPQIIESADEELIPLIQELLLNDIDVAPLQSALNTLQDYGLAWRIDADDEAIESFRIHDLAYSYTLAQADYHDHERALDACLAYTQHYNRPSLANFCALHPELNNLIYASNYAFTHARWQDAERFISNLYNNSEILVYRGFYRETTILFTQAAAAARQRGDHEAECVCLGNLGNAYSDLGQHDKAIDFHTQALTISRQIGNKNLECGRLIGLANSYEALAQYDKAIDFHTQALAISHQIGDKYSEGNILGNLALTYDSLGRYEKAIELHTQALTISRQIGDKHDLGIRLANLGTTYANLNQFEKAIDFHTQALTIALEIGDKPGEGSRLGNLGKDYASLRQPEKAIEFYTQALTISRQIGDKNGEDIHLGNLGIIYRDLRQYGKAIEFFSQALTISYQVGDKYGEGNALANLGTVYASLEQYDKAIEYYQQARTVFVTIGVPHLIELTDSNIALTQANRQGGTSSATVTEEQHAQAVAALVKMYREQGENAVRDTLKQAGISDETIDQLIPQLQAALEGDE
jgi:tetratricopeptide (TPR) repeat protein